MHHGIAAKMQDATRGQAEEQALTQVHHRVSLSGQFFARHRADSSTARAAYLDVYGRCRRRRRRRLR